MGPNTTGKPNTNDYNLGRGVVYFALHDANGRPKAWRDLGNAPEFNVTIEEETLEHQSSREGLKTTDKEVTISKDMSLTFQLDEINHENLASFLSGEKATHTNVAVAGFTEWEMVPAGELEAGRWYDIKNSSHARAYDVDSTKLTVKTTNASPVTLALNTDYELDETMGRIFLISTSSAVTTAVGAGEGLDVTLTADAGASAVSEVRALTQSNLVGSLKFISENPASNDVQTEYEWHQVTLKSDGDFGLISDEWTTMGFAAKAEKNTTYTNSSTLTIRNVA